MMLKKSIAAANCTAMATADGTNHRADLDVGRKVIACSSSRRARPGLPACRISPSDDTIGNRTLPPAMARPRLPAIVPGTGRSAQADTERRASQGTIDL
jgi:hypothetical protein